MNSDGEYIRKTRCPICIHGEHSPKYMRIERNHKCSNWRRK